MATAVFIDTEAAKQYECAICLHVMIRPVQVYVQMYFATISLSNVPAENRLDAVAATYSAKVAYSSMPTISAQHVVCRMLHRRWFPFRSSTEQSTISR